MQQRFLKIGHRGSPKVAPGNTMKGFGAAAVDGCQWVECDCRPSADGVIVLSHDDRVRDCDGNIWVIEEHPAGDLRGLNLGAGEGVPSLAELVEWAVSCGMGIMADMKCSGYEREVGRLLAPLAATDKIVPGASEEDRRTFRSLFPDLPLSWSVDAGPENEALLDRCLSDGTLDTEAVTIEHPLATPERVARLHDAGLRVYAWTVDSLDRMHEVMAAGVDGIISNRSDLLRGL